MATKSENRRINLFINGKEVQNDIKSISSEYQKAKNVLAGMTIGSKEYISQAKEVRNLKGILNDHAKSIGGVQGTWQKFKTQMGGWIAGGFGLLAAGQVFRKFINDMKDFEKGASELSALTGLMGSDLQFLKDEALNMGSEFKRSGIYISQSATDILEAFKIVGSAKPELLKDKEALSEVTKQAIILSEAAGMQLEPAVNALTLTMNQFGASANESARFINVLAAGSKEGAAEIPDLTDSIREFGTVASLSNISIEESVALVEALAEKGLKGSRAGTGIRNVLLELMSGANDTNPKIVGLNKALENLAGKNLTAAEMTKKFGKENVVSAGILINTRDRVNELNTAVSNTNTAYEQAATNTDNLKGRLDSLSVSWTNFGISLNEGNSVFTRALGSLVNYIGGGLDLLAGTEKKSTEYMASLTRFNNALINSGIDSNKQIEEQLVLLAKLEGMDFDFILDKQKELAELYAMQNPYKTKKTKTKDNDDQNKDDKFDPSKIGDEKISSILGLLKQKQDQFDEEKKKEQKKADELFAFILDMEKQKQEAYKESREQIIIDLDKSYREEANLRQIAHNEELTALGTNKEARKALDERFKKEELIRQIEHLKNVLAESEKILDSSGIEGSIGAMLTDEEKEALLSKIDELKVKISELKAKDSDGEEIDPFGMTPEDWDKLLERVQKAANVAYQLGDIWNSINQRIANDENANLANYEKNTDRRKKALEDQLKKGLISQKKYDDEVAALNAKLDAEKKKIEIDQAKRARTAAVFNILINTATATINALNTQPFALGLVMAALAIAAGVAAIASLPPVPSYAEGGFTKGDKMYRAGEEGKEWIAPAWMNEHPYISPVIRSLEAVRSGVAPETIFRSPVTPVYEATNSTFPGGDIEAQSPLSETKFDRMIHQNQVLIDQNADLLLYLKDPENRRSVIVYDDIEKSKIEVNTMLNKAGF
jgi:TP901 family phage tail tape measure protein